LPPDAAGAKPGELSVSCLMRAARSWPALLCYLAVLVYALTLVRPSGDGGEYLLTARALIDHGHPDIRVTDAMWIARESRWQKFSRRVAGGIQLGELTPRPSIRRATNGAYYSLHFWFYSWLATPFLWLVELEQWRPSLALAAVNGLSACVGIGALFARF